MGIRPFWVTFVGFVGAAILLSGLMVLARGQMIGLLLVAAGFAYSAVIFWPRLYVRGDSVVVRNVRTLEFPLESVRGVVPGGSTYSGATFLLDVVARPAPTIWALYIPGSFGRIGEERMGAYAAQATAAIDRHRPSLGGV